MTGQQTKQPSESVMKAGRGLLSITASKLYFILAGYAVALTLPRLLGTPEAFGLYSATVSSISVINNVMNVATIQTVSKRISENLEQASTTLREGLRLQLLVGGVLGGTFFFAAPILAKNLLLDPLMVPYFRVVSIVLFSNALYATLVGSLNGRQLFQRQAALDMTYTTLRSTCILGAAALGLGVLGALSGLSCSVLILLVISLYVVGIGRPSNRLVWKRWLALMAPLWLYHLSINLILLIDMLVLKRTVAAIALAAGETPAIAADIASRYAGFYKAAQTFAFVPYQLLLPVTFIVFPMVSKTISDDDIVSTRNTIREAMRFSLLACLAIASPIAGAASGVMRLAYPVEYLAGSGALSVLTLGIACFALFVISATLLSGAGHPTAAAVIGIFSLCIVVTGNVSLLYLAGIGDQTLVAVATGTTMGTSFALVVSAYAVYRYLGATIALASLCRGLLAALAGFLTAYIVPSNTRLFSLAALVAGGLVYLAALFVLREIRQSDIEMIKRLARKT
ncbi:MAG: oligosaccharide flippase family protein [Deltaproteobacteria bacterium]|nr:oligosaccharide flippase family protein [Deltaproteobacteria bacterium]